MFKLMINQHFTYFVLMINGAQVSAVYKTMGNYWVDSWPVTLNITIQCLKDFSQVGMV